MSRLSHLREMLRDAKRLNLGLADTCRLLGSYYLQRADARSNHGKAREPFLIEVEAGERTLRVPVRPNGVDHDILTEIFADSIYDQGDAPISTILDLGANTGMATLYFSARYPGAALACVEPSPQNVPVLERALRINGVRAALFKAAVGLENGTATFYMADDPTCSSLLPREGAAEAVTVPVLSVESLMDSLGWDRIGLLKIDIEGYERHLFSARPEWLSRVDAITGEIHSGYTFDQLQSDLGAFGFRTRRIWENLEYGMVVFSAAV
jgi:FkbM family methyltransferase